MPETIRLIDLYTPRELTEESEALGLYILNNMDDEEDWAKPHEVKTMQPEELRRLVTYFGSTPVMQTVRYAEQWQRNLILEKAANFDEKRIIVIAGNQLLDGTHHVIAAKRVKRPVQYIDLEASPSQNNAPNNCDKPGEPTDLNSLRDVDGGPKNGVSTALPPTTLQQDQET